VTSVAVRRLAPGDLPALRPIVEAAVAAGEFTGSSDPEGAWFLKFFPDEADRMAGAFDRDELVGFIAPGFKVVVVRPDRRREGIGRRLVETGLELDRAAGNAATLLGPPPGSPGAVVFVEALGFRWHSAVWDLDLPRDRPVPTPAWPPGLAARPFDIDRDVAAWVAVFNAAFADHATPLQIEVAQIEKTRDDPAVEDADTILVEEAATSELIGFCATAPERSNGAIAPHAEIWAIGVRPDRQGAGLGRQLLRAGVARLRSIGVVEVSLTVNGRNDHALGLYESEGFVRRRTRDRWARSVDGDGGGTA
jgi:mycothiol synthase